MLSALALSTVTSVLGCEKHADCPSDVPASSSAAASSEPTLSQGPPKLRGKGTAVGPKPDNPSAPEGYVTMDVVGVAGSELANVVLLGNAGDEVIPIFVGGTEALSIHLRFNGKEYQRPLTHDLLDSVMSTLDGKFVHAQVDKLENDIFFGSVFIERDGKMLKIDSRPSDAIALALGSAAPIYVAEDVVEKASVSRDEAMRPERAPGDPLSL